MQTYVLHCEDASHLGGRMGTEYTTLLFTKVFKNLNDAKNFPSQYQKDILNWASWEKYEDRWVMDSGQYIWTIELQSIL
jgi:hypothetical protein